MNLEEMKLTWKIKWKIRTSLEYAIQKAVNILPALLNGGKVISKLKVKSEQGSTLRKYEIWSYRPGNKRNGVHTKNKLETT
jgi:hypothetical protein